MLFGCTLLLLATTASAFRAPLSAVHASRVGAITMAESRPKNLASEEKIDALPEDNFEYFPTGQLSATPSDDPAMTCFLAPDWMTEDPDKPQWLCVPDSDLSTKDRTRPSFRDDSY